MAKLLPPSGPRSTKRVAVIGLEAFRVAGVDPGEYPLFCERLGEDVHVAISPAARDYLSRLGEGRRDEELIGALPFGEANSESRRRGGGHRLWSTDFALLHGARTEGEVNDWMTRQGVVNRARDVGTLYVPDSSAASGVVETGGDWWILERKGTTFLLPEGRYRTGRAGTELFQQLLEELDETLVRDLVSEATSWSEEASRRFGGRRGPLRRKDERPLIVEALLRALGAPWDEAGRLGTIYRPPSSRADLTRYLDFK